MLDASLAVEMVSLSGMQLVGKSVDWKVDFWVGELASCEVAKKDLQMVEMTE